MLKVMKMNSKLLVHTHSTSKTTALPNSSHEPLAYSEVTHQVSQSSTLVTALIAENFPDLFLRCPISARVSWSKEMNCYLASDYIFHWHGQGITTSEALQDLADAIAEDYDDLRQWPGELSLPLQNRLAIMERYFEDAS